MDKLLSLLPLSVPDLSNIPLKVLLTDGLTIICGSKRFFLAFFDSVPVRPCPLCFPSKSFLGVNVKK